MGRMLLASPPQSNPVGSIDPPSTSNPRIGFLESIRGLAAIQVVLLHEFSAFFPGLVFSWPSQGVYGLVHFSPIFLLYDGYSAVYVFFALSGYVLAPLFAKHAGHPARALLSRWWRIALPALAASLFSFAIFQFTGTAHIAVGARLHSSWIAAVWRPASGWRYFAYDWLVQGLTLGYSGKSIFDGARLSSFIKPSEFAYVSPFWTLSAEMQGSLLILALAMCVRVNRRFGLICAAAAGLLLIRTFFAPFVLGFLLAEGNGLARLRLLGPRTLALLAASGFSLCVLGEYRPIFDALGCPVDAAIWTPCTEHPLKIYGASLVFAAALGSVRLAEFLNAPIFRWMGRLSFPIYLVHWPIICGVGAATYLAVSNRVGNYALLPSAVAVVVSLLLSIGAAQAFAGIDRWAVVSSRIIRGKP